MFDWMRRESDLTQARFREARLKRLAKVPEAPDQESFTSRAFCQPKTRFATKPKGRVDASTLCIAPGPWRRAQ